MDENFYKFLIEVYYLKEASEKLGDTQKMADAFQKALLALKEQQPNPISLKEYVLIPADVTDEIAYDNISKRKSLNEALDLLFVTPSKNRRNKNQQDKINGTD